MRMTTHPLAVAYMTAYAAEGAYRESVESWGPAERAMVRPLEEASILAHRAWRLAKYPTVGCDHETWYADREFGVQFCSLCHLEIPKKLVDRARLELDLAMAARRTSRVNDAVPLLDEQLVDLLRRAQRMVSPLAGTLDAPTSTASLAICKQLAKMLTSSEMSETGSGMSGEDAIDRLSAMIHLAREVVYPVST